jgi:hypothetical protein
MVTAACGRAQHSAAIILLAMSDERPFTERIETRAALHGVAVHLAGVTDLEIASGCAKRELESDFGAIHAT